MIAGLRNVGRAGGALVLVLVVATGSGLAAAGADPASRNANGALAATASGATPGLGDGPGEGAVAGRVSVSPVVVEVRIVTRGTRAKQATEAQVTVVNLSRTKLASVVVSLGVSPASVAQKPVGTKTLRNIAAGRAASTSWTLCSVVEQDVLVVATVTALGSRTSSAPLLIRLPPSARC